MENCINIKRLVVLLLFVLSAYRWKETSYENSVCCQSNVDGGVEKSLINLLNSIDNSKFEVTLVIKSNEISLIDKINSKCKIIIIDRTDEGYKFGFLYGLGQRCDNPSIIHRLVLW